MPLHIRPATQADAALVALLGRITFAETFGHLFSAHPDDLRAYLDATFGVAKIERSLGAPCNRYWLAHLDQLPVGYAKLKHASSPPGQPEAHASQLQKIYVLRDFLARHVGRALLQQVEVAAGAGPTLWLDVLQENERAILFYERHGFRRTGTDTYAIGAQSFRFHVMAKDMP